MQYFDLYDRFIQKDIRLIASLKTQSSIIFNWYRRKCVRHEKSKLIASASCFIWQNCKFHCRKDLFYVFFLHHKYLTFNHLNMSIRFNCFIIVRKKLLFCCSFCSIAFVHLLKLRECFSHVVCHTFSLIREFSGDNTIKEVSFSINSV